VARVNLFRVSCEPAYCLRKRFAKIAIGEQWNPWRRGDRGKKCYEQGD
jgi:hypothetical protein